MHLLDNDGEIEVPKLYSFIDAQMKNFSESSSKEADSISLWTPVIKESFENCVNKSNTVHELYDTDTKKYVKSTEENLEPLFLLMCSNLHNFAVRNKFIDTLAH